jgi:hypothetical protein
VVPQPRVLSVRRLLAVAVVVGVAALWRATGSGARDDGRAAEPPLPGPAAPRGPSVMLDDEAAVGENWALWTSDGVVRWATVEEARAVCTRLGAQWALPAARDSFPELRPWPRLPDNVPVWTETGEATRLTMGDRPTTWISPDTLSARYHAVLCTR